jgi:hypothetical protein
MDRRKLEQALATVGDGCFLVVVTPLRTLLALCVLLLLACGGAWVLRERIFEWWLRENLARELAGKLDAEVAIDGLRWSDGVLSARSLRLTGGHLPFLRLEATDVRTAADWRHLLEPSSRPLGIEAATVAMILPGESSAVAAQGGGRPAAVLPEMDILAAKFSMERAGQAAWKIRESSVRAQHKDGRWSVSGSGGAMTAPGFPELTIERFAAEQTARAWSIPVFALKHDEGGALAGSASKPAEGAWSGEFTWQDLPLGALTGSHAGPRFDGKGRGDGVLKDGVLRGSMKVTGAVTREVPSLVKMASLFAGEDWSEIPWETLSFDFVRGADGSVKMENLQAVSSKGLTVSGAGFIAPLNLSADLQLGVRRANRPWLVAFMPVLFRYEKDGYLWTPVRVRGTPQKPTEDLSTRVVAALALVPAGGAVEAATEIPGAAVEAAGSMIRGFLGN